MWASCSWRVRGLGWPACLVVLRGGYSKAGGPVVWFSPRFFFFLCGADDGGWTRCLRLGRVVLWPGGLRPQVCVPRLSVALLFVCAWLSLGFGADDGGWTRGFRFGKVAL